MTRADMLRDAAEQQTETHRAERSEYRAAETYEHHSTCTCRQCALDAGAQLDRYRR